MENLINNVDIKNKTVEEIKILNDNKNLFKLSNESLNDAYKENDIRKMKYLKDSFNLKLQTDGSFHVDIAVEEGNEEMAKFLVQEFHSKPSLYEKQMSHINGHSNLSFWMDKYAEQRNNLGIDSVYKRFDGDKGWIWNDCIPMAFRY